MIWLKFSRVFQRPSVEFLSFLFFSFLLFYFILFFFFNDTATTEIYTLSLHDALPIWSIQVGYKCKIGRKYPDKKHRAEARRLVSKSVWIEGMGPESRTNTEDSHGWTLMTKGEIGRAHVWTPVTDQSRMPSSAWKKKKKHHTHTPPPPTPPHTNTQTKHNVQTHNQIHDQL